MQNIEKTLFADSISYYGKSVFDKALINKDFKNLLERTGNAQNSICVISPQSAKSFILSLLLPFIPKRVAVICPSEEEAQSFKEDLDAFLGLMFKKKIHNLHLPEQGTAFDSSILTERTLESKRLECLYLLSLTGSEFIVSGSQRAFIGRTLPVEALKEATLKIIKGRDYDLGALEKALLENGYSKEAKAESIGSFAVRGGLLDVFAPLYAKPLRIDFMGDRVDSIRRFDSETQLSTGEEIDSASIVPVKEIISSPERVARAKEFLKDLADSLDIPKRKRKAFLETLNPGSHPMGIESLLPSFYESVSTPCDYLGGDTFVVLINSSRITQKAAENESLEFRQYEKIKDDGRFALHPESLFMTSSEFCAKIKKWRTLSMDDFAVESDNARRTDFVSQEIKMPIASDLSKSPDKILLEAVRERELSGLRVFMFFEQKASCMKTANLLKENSSRFHIDESCMERDGKIGASEEDAPVIITKGRLSRSFDLESLELAFIDEISLFKKKRSAGPIASRVGDLLDISEIKPGDYVVHRDHGIGRYEGLKHLNIGGADGDFILLTYDGEDKLYLPIYRMDLVHRYIGKDGSKPKLSRLGSAVWERTKSRALKAITGMASDLLRLYAKRKIMEGFAFSPPDKGFKEFQSLFPYEQTPDQSKTLDDVLKDMESAKPMDRLVCGDVGYGKTEVALCAAYKASMDGKQVALLVPTTVLAQQHYETFSKRFADYPVKVDYLSRFKGPREIKRSIEGLQTGSTDIVIGTHRLLSQDVKFKDLGLLILDEEHRFGVNQKEKIKKYRNIVDVLALSATPIPRSLQMSLVGLRDLSIINTPPPDRKAVKTVIAHFDENLIRDAVKREIERGGQVFFMHNRIETIDSVYGDLKRLLPEIRIGVAHGQMKESKLESVMLDFLNRRTDLLLSTAIIESGLDIPSANTIIINRADALGLAQLYQLRGRVGRSPELAYAYLLIPKAGTITVEAHERLRALRSFTELGSGIKIAIRDLEIRGAGNIFGAAQSGHIAAIGLEMYTKILERTIRKLKGMDVEDEYEPEMKINIEAFIQDSYISNVGERLAQYKRLAHASSEEEIEAIRAELIDRFGPVPKRLDMLLNIISLKLTAKKLKAKELYVDRSAVYIKLDENAVSGEGIVEAFKKGSLSYTKDGKIKLNISEADPYRRVKAAKKMLLNLL